MTNKTPQEQLRQSLQDQATAGDVSMGLWSPERRAAELRLAKAQARQRAGKLASSDPEGHRQAIADHQAETSSAVKASEAEALATDIKHAIAELTEDRFPDLIAAIDRLAALAAKSEPSSAVKASDMVLHCPECHIQHIDAPDLEPCKDGCQYAKDAGQAEYSCAWGSCMYLAPGSEAVRWTNPPHRSHLCHACGCIWRPCDTPTNGVAAIQTRGKDDTWPKVDGPLCEKCKGSDHCTGACHGVWPDGSPMKDAES